jgi:hypothetical protein
MMNADELVAVVDEILGRVLPFRVGDSELTYGGARGDAEGGIFATLNLLTYAGGELRDLRQQEVEVVPASASDPARIQAYFQGWERALPGLWERASALSGEWVMPGELFCPPVLDDETATTAEDFAGRMLSDSGPWRRWRAEVTGEPIPLDDAVYQAFLDREQPESPEETKARRARALDETNALFPRVAARVRELYGLDLPPSLAVFWAFYTSLSQAELEAYEEGLDLYQPAGILDFFKPGGLARKPLEGLDACLHWRFRSDPPELVTVATGGSDGEHLGLFYDDPAKLPSGVVRNYARDSAETWWAEATLLDVLRKKLDDYERDQLTPDDPEDVLRASCQLRLLREAMAAFEGAEAEARAEDAPRLVMPYEERSRLPSIVSGVGVIAPGSSAPPYIEAVEGRGRPFPDEVEARGFVEEARRALAAGDVAHALALGRDLHWADIEALRAETLELLVGAYRALGREALAAIAEAHHRHRDLTSVAVLEPDQGG